MPDNSDPKQSKKKAGEEMVKAGMTEFHFYQMIPSTSQIRVSLSSFIRGYETATSKNQLNCVLDMTYLKL